MSSEQHIYMSSCLWRDRHPVMGCSQKLQGCIWNGPKSRQQHKGLGKAEHKEQILHQHSTDIQENTCPLCRAEILYRLPQNQSTQVIVVNSFLYFYLHGVVFLKHWWEKDILETSTLQQIMFLFSIRMSNYTPESCFGKESLNIVLHKECAGTTMFHKTLTLKYSKHLCICYIKIMPFFFFLILAPVAVSISNYSLNTVTANKTGTQLKTSRLILLNNVTSYFWCISLIYCFQTNFSS